MLPGRRSLVLRWAGGSRGVVSAGIAALATGLAVALVTVLDTVLAQNITPPFMAAVAVAALLAGRGAAFLTVGLAACTIPVLYADTHGVASLATAAGMVRLAIFSVSAIAVALVCGSLHAQWHSAEQQARENLRLRELAEEAAVQAEEETARAEDDARRATQEAARAAAALEGLRRTRDELEAILRASPIAICSVDPGGAARTWNRAAEQVFGWTATEVIGNRLPNVPAARTDEHRAVREGVLAGQTFTGFETKRVRKDGQELDVLLSTAPLHDGAGHVTGVVGMYEDITDRKQLEAQFRQAQKMEAVGRLAGGVAHDFNNMLTVIQTAAGCLLGDLEAGDPRRTDAEDIEDAARRAARLTRQLLAFSRQQVLQPRVLDLNAVVTGLEPLVRRVVEESVVVLTRLASGLGTVKADPTQLDQIILNLVVNARDAMPEGGTLLIETANVVLDDSYPRLCETVRPGPHVVLSVSDTGCGMDAGTQARIFEPFFTTKPAGQGTGLGLATVYGVVKQSGGHIWVYSEPGNGTTFKIYLPRHAGAGEVEAKVSARPAVHDRSPCGGAAILLVEDDPAVRGSVRRVLERHRYLVREAADGSEAVAALAESDSHFDLVLADMVMPSMGGLELRRRLRVLRPRMPVLLMSGYSEEAITRLGHEDVGPLLEKPFTVEGMLAKVEEMLSLEAVDA